MSKNTTISQLKKELQEDIDNILKALVQVEKNVVMEVIDALLEPKAVGGTPKKTGHLRSNYIITTDQKYEGVVGSPENVDKSKREESIASFKNSTDLLNKSNIYINNNVEYGPKVNSDQRFREASIQRGLKRLKTERVIK